MFNKTLYDIHMQLLDLYDYAEECRDDDNFDPRVYVLIELLEAIMHIYRDDIDRISKKKS